MPSPLDDFKRLYQGNFLDDEKLFTEYNTQDAYTYGTAGEYNSRTRLDPSKITYDTSKGYQGYGKVDLGNGQFAYWAPQDSGAPLQNGGSWQVSSEKGGLGPDSNILGQVNVGDKSGYLLKDAPQYNWYEEKKDKDISIMDMALPIAFASGPLGAAISGAAAGAGALGAEGLAGGAFDMGIGGIGESMGLGGGLYGDAGLALGTSDIASSGAFDVGGMPSYESAAAGDTAAAGGFDAGGMPEYTSPNPDFGYAGNTPTDQAIQGWDSAGNVSKAGNSQRLLGEVMNQVRGISGGANSVMKVLNGTATTADWLKLGANVGATLLGIMSSNKQADSLKGIADRAAAERAPFLGAATNWLNNPSAYFEGPGKASMDATMRALSAKYGNPIGSPTAMTMATQAGLQDWRSAVTGIGSMGLGSQNLIAQLQAQAAGAGAGAYNALGFGLNALTSNQPSLEDLIRQLRNSGISIGAPV